MAGCLLSELPAGALQAILNNLNPADYASLREVSRSVREHTTEHIPYISLLLTDRSELLQQWYEATHSLQHVNNIHIHVVCDITEEVLDLAMQLLSQRSAVKELHILGSPDAVSMASCSNVNVHTLRPLKHLSPSLQTVVIEGIALPDLLGDLRHLEAAARAAQGWKLQSLTCHAEYYEDKGVVSSDESCEWQNHYLWSEFSQAIMQLPVMFPLLQHLSLQMAYLDYNPHKFNQLSSAAGHPAVEGRRQVPELVTEEIAQCAVITAAAHAALQLKHLEILKITDIPDIWTAGSAGTVVAAAAAALQVLCGPSSLPLLTQLKPPSGTAAAFATLDHYGCWLLQQHQKLKQLQIRPYDITWDISGCGMSWQRQQQQQPNQCTNRNHAPGGCCKAAELLDLQLDTFLRHIKDVNAATELPPAIASINNDSSSNSSNGNSDYSQHVEFTRRLSLYSSRPPSLLMEHISSCDLDIDNDAIGFLADLLSNMKSLKHLQMRAMYPEGLFGTSTLQADASMAVLAAAAVPGLRSLSLEVRTVYTAKQDGRAEMHLPADLLLPLTAAAGGPGSSLTSLEIIGQIDPVSAASADVAAAEATKSWASAADGASVFQGDEWHHPLLQLDGLRELTIMMLNGRAQERLDFPVECLPAGLEVFEGDGLHIITNTAAAAASSGASDPCSNVPKAPCRAANVDLHLQKLKLSCCHLSCPSILASNQLQQLKLYKSSWSGGWAAAAAAWPNLNQLRWTCPSVSSSSVAVKCSAQPITSADFYQQDHSHLSTALWDTLDVFRCLKCLSVGFPPAGRECADRFQVAIEQARQSGRAYVWHHRTVVTLSVMCGALRCMSSS